MSQTIILFCYLVALSGTNNASSPREVQKIVFEERTIEGKIRKPLLVLITAEQRPTFKPMFVQNRIDEIPVYEFLRSDAVVRTPMDDAFIIDNFDKTRKNP